MITGTLVSSMLCRRGINSLILMRSTNGLSGLNALKSAKWLTTTAAAQDSSKVLPNEDFWNKNKRLNRPMSPHLTIYKPQYTSMLSITHRGTGLGLAMLTSAFAIGMLAASHPFPYYIDILQQSHLGTAFLFSAKFVLAWPLAFHFLNGVRHLAWDLGKGFEISTLNKTGNAVMIGSVVLSLIAAVL